MAMQRPPAPFCRRSGGGGAPGVRSPVRPRGAAATRPRPGVPAPTLPPDARALQTVGGGACPRPPHGPVCPPRVTLRRVDVSLRGPGRSPVRPLRVLRRVAAFCRPLRPVLLLVSFPRPRSPVVGVLGLCRMWQDVPFARQRRPVVGVLG